MNTQGVKRKLTAILSADVVGYSRLMGEDDAATVRTLGEYREVMANYIIQYRGRVVDSPGDNLLAEFASVVDAVQCAAEIQRELAERNSEIPDARKMQYRIGVNLGDVIEEGDRIYGDGVNVAARLESLAEPGGICISGIAHDQVKNKINLEYQFVGKKSVKNIKEPIRVYRVLSFPGAAAHRVRRAKKAVGKSWRNVVVAIAAVLILGGGAFALWHFYFRPSPAEVVTEAEMAFPLPDKPSIAVLPFVNVSGDSGQEYIADGITEQIIATLARSPFLFVIASNSTFTYKGKPVKVQQVSRELGVQYVVEGSVQKSGDRIRITAQLVNATTGKHLWAETWDRNLKDIFALQDEIAMKLLETTTGKFIGAGTDQTRTKGTKNIGAYLKRLKAYNLVTTSEANNHLARRLAQEAIALDPEFAHAHTDLGFSYWGAVMSGWSQSPRKDMKKAFEMAQKSISLDRTLSRSYGLLGWIYLTTGKHEKAISEGKRAVAAAPNGFAAHWHLGSFLTWADRPEEAIVLLENAFRLNPFPTALHLKALADAYFMAGRYEEALAAYKRMQKLNPDNMWAYLTPAAIYGYLGRIEEAQAAAKQVLRLDPDFSVKNWEKWLGCKNREKWNQWLDGVRKAGLPDKPPVPVPE